MCKKDNDDIWKPLADFLGEMILKYWDELKDSLEESEIGSKDTEGDDT